MPVKRRSSTARARRSASRTGAASPGRWGTVVLVVAAGSLFGIGWNLVRDNGLYASAPASSFEVLPESPAAVPKAEPVSRPGPTVRRPPSAPRPPKPAVSAKVSGQTPPPVAPPPPQPPVAPPPVPTTPVPEAPAAVAPALAAPVPAVRVIGLPEARTFAAQGTAIFVDARSANHFRLGHIPRALNIPNSDFDAGYAKVRPLLPVAARIVVYCTSADCDEAELVIARLLPLGYRQLLHFKGGWADWENARLPQETGPGAGGESPR